MKSVDWEDLFRRHPVFSSLTEAEIRQLLTHEASQEREYPLDAIIVRAGEPGDSLFLIGSGSVQVTAFGVPLAVLQAGEFFGEIAVLERKPRTAAVTAREQCLLLEIRGETFRTLLEAHPEIHAKVRAKMNERISRSSRQ
jgi:CRP-like cAMP-binding protein